MMMLDRDIGRASALVIDGNPNSRSIATNQLREMGVGQVVQATRLADGRSKLESQRYDIVLCEQSFPGDEQKGQDLLDDLRRSKLLPYTTVFVMISGEARYEQVAEAAESALDCFLLRPYAADTLSARLQQARRRKRSLSPIFAAIEDGQHAQAARLCLERFHARDEYWLYAARMGAELLLLENQPQAAGELYRSIHAARPQSWARLGVARAELEAGELASAQRLLEELTAAEPQYADAWDALGRLQLDQARAEPALASARKALELTPSSIPRLQTLGMLAYELGQTTEAIRALDRAALLGAGSRMFDPQVLLVLAFARYHHRDAKGVQRCRERLALLAAREPPAAVPSSTARLQRLQRMVAALDALAAQRLGECLQAVQTLAEERDDPALDTEAACHLLRLWAHLAASGQRPEGMEAWVERIGVRFSTSRAVAEMLTRAVAPHPPFADLLAQAHAKVLAMSEEAMQHALQGNPSHAVRKLLAHAEATPNAKLVDTARLTLQRHRARITDAEALDHRIAAMRERYRAAWSVPRSGLRSAGGLSLRAGTRRTPVGDLPADTAPPSGPGAALH